MRAKKKTRRVRAGFFAGRRVDRARDQHADARDVARLVHLSGVGVAGGFDGNQNTYRGPQILTRTSQRSYLWSASVRISINLLAPSGPEDARHALMADPVAFRRRRGHDDARLCARRLKAKGLDVRPDDLMDLRKDRR